jgi:UDP-N-acetylmuramate dehydrogenase
MKMIGLPKVSKKLEIDKLKQSFGEKLEFEKALAPFTSFNTGGPAKYFISANSKEEIKKSVNSAVQLEIPFFIIGGGSNLLVSDKGFDGLIIKIDIMGIELNKETEIVCGAGENLMDLIEFCVDNSLTGLEFASGIWGSVGGAVCGNAGAYGGEIKDIITSVTIIKKDGTIEQVDKDYCQFEYRDSYLKKTGDIVIDACFQLKKSKQEEIRKRVDEIIEIRSGKHPVKGKSAGSFFKNIPDDSELYGKLPAGRLLEEAGVKEMSVGGASVYTKHANMIVNNGNATSKDIRKLADNMKETVFKKFGIMLEEEVVSVGEF